MQSREEREEWWAGGRQGAREDKQQQHELCPVKYSESGLIVTDYGATSCPDRTIAITDQDRCDEALDFVPISARWGDECQDSAGQASPFCEERPVGCVQDASGHLLFNARRGAFSDHACSAGVGVLVMPRTLLQSFWRFHNWH